MIPAFALYCPPNNSASETEKDWNIETGDYWENEEVRNLKLVNKVSPIAQKSPLSPKISEPVCKNNFTTPSLKQKSPVYSPCYGKFSTNNNFEPSFRKNLHSPVHKSEYMRNSYEPNHKIVSSNFSKCPEATPKQFEANNWHFKVAKEHSDHFKFPLETLKELPKSKDESFSNMWKQGFKKPIIQCLESSSENVPKSADSLKNIAPSQKESPYPQKLLLSKPKFASEETIKSSFNDSKFPLKPLTIHKPYLQNKKSSISTAKLASNLPHSSVKDIEIKKPSLIIKNNAHHEISNIKPKPLIKYNEQKIDPSTLPRPFVGVEPATEKGGKKYTSDRYFLPPHVLSNFSVFDKENSTCRFMRCSINQIPQSSITLKTSKIPFVCSVQMFPILSNYEEPVPLLNFNKGSHFVPEYSSSSGPMKCSHCQAYINPHVTIVSQSTVSCNFCGFDYPVPDHYRNLLSQIPLSRTQRNNEELRNKPPEFNEFYKGTIDYVASEDSLDDNMEYSQRCPVPISKNLPICCFVIDVSYFALKTNSVKLYLDAIEYSIPFIPNGVKVCILTFSDQINFYPINQNYFNVLVVNDLESPFMPLPNNILCGTDKDKIYSIINFIRTNCQLQLQSKSPQSCGNSALSCAIELIKDNKSGGILNMFYSSYPNLGLGSLDEKSLNSIKGSFSLPKSLNTFYDDLSVKCNQNSICVDVYTVPMLKSQMHLEVLSNISNRTGGKCYFYDSIPSAIYPRMSTDLINTFVKPVAFNCRFKIQVSRGLDVLKAYNCSTIIPTQNQNLAKLYKVPSLLQIPRMDSDTMLLFELRHKGELHEDDRYVLIQCSVVYTTWEGYRRIRKCTLVLETTTSLSTLFRYSSVEVVLAYFVRYILENICTGKLMGWKETVTNHFVQLLFAYRLHCAATASSGQLILPDTLKDLALYLSSLYKHPALRGQKCLEITDERCYLILKLLNMPLNQFLLWIYPRIFVLHRTSVNNEKLKRMGDLTPLDDEYYLPQLIQCDGTLLMSDGIYLLDDGVNYLMYVGEDVDFSIKQQLFGHILSQNHENIYLDVHALPGELGRRISNVFTQLNYLKNSTFPWQPVRLIQAKTLEESHFLSRLVENSYNFEEGYVEYLCRVYKAVYVLMEAF